jgi:hypothetical protein
MNLRPRSNADLDRDLLGPIYESQLDGDQRRARGQYYSSQPLVSFILDRVGFTGESLFRTERGQRVPRMIADFSAGSGAFLIEAARRIRHAVLQSPDVGIEDLRLATRAILEGIVGIDIDPTACDLARVNLLRQLSPILAALRQKGCDDFSGAEKLTPAILDQDALCLLGPVRSSGFSRPRHASNGPTEDRLKAELRTDFDFICSNPPYLGEKGHKDLFRDVLRHTPGWKPFYQGKMDYFYWFIILGLSKLRPGGRLAYITTGYWHTADGASKLRRYILERAKIVEMIDFGPARLFPDAPGQHNMVFVLERCEDEAQRRCNVPKLVQAKCGGNAGRVFQPVPRSRAGWKTRPALLDHIHSHMGIASGETYEDEQIRVLWSPMLQGELGGQAWHIFHEDDAEAVLRRIAAAGQPLGQVCRYVQGVVSGADRVTRGHLRLLPPEIVKQHGIRAGDGIFVLSAEERAGLQLSEQEQSLVKPTYKNSQVTKYVVDAAIDGPEYLLYIAPGCGFSPSATPALFVHLEKFKAVLQRKRECQIRDRRTGQPRRQWFELHWPRDQGVLEGEKLVTPRRAAENRFAYVTGEFYENSDLAMLLPRNGVREGLKYLLALLNSAVLDFWYAHRGKRKGRMREFYRTPLEAVPIRRIRFEPATDEQEKRRLLTQLRTDLDAEQYDAACAGLRQSLQAGQEDVVHDGLGMLADRMIALTGGLARYSRHFGTRLTRLAAVEPLPPLVLAAMLGAEQMIEEVVRLRRRMALVQAVIDETVMDLYGICEPAARRLLGLSQPRADLQPEGGDGLDLRLEP